MSNDQYLVHIINYEILSTFELTIITNTIIYCIVVLFPLQTQS